MDSFLTLMVVVLRALLKMPENERQRTCKIVDWRIRYLGIHEGEKRATDRSAG